MKEKRHSKLKIVLLVLLCALLLATGAFFIYTSIYYSADGTAITLTEVSLVPVQETDSFIACGNGDTATAGYIFYPGAKVDAKAYLPYLLEVAQEADVFCAVVKPSFRLAIFSPNEARDIMAAYSGVDSWVVGGHSLGGVVAAGFAGKNEAEVNGLVLLASYPNVDLSQSGLSVLTITATNDRVLNTGAYHKAREKLPQSTEFVVIEGGNHAGFGRYGEQKGDGPASIPAMEQQNAAAAETAAFILEVA